MRSSSFRLLGAAFLLVLSGAAPHPARSVAGFPLARVAPNQEGKRLSEMPAGLYRSDPDHTHVYFTYSHVGYSSSHGRFDKVAATLDFRPTDPGKSPLELTIDSRSVDMNQHELESILKSERYFAADRYPEIKFVSQGLTITGPREGLLRGTLSMKGMSRPVEFKVSLNRFLIDEPKWTRFGFTATGSLRRSEWGMGAMPIVGDLVDIQVDIEFLKVV